MVSFKLEANGRNGKAYVFHHVFKFHDPVAERSLGHVIHLLLDGEWWQYEEVRITKERGEEDGVPEKD
jgi:hypothetical protein